MSATADTACAACFQLEVVDRALEQNPAAVEFVPKLLSLAADEALASRALSRCGKALQFADASVQQNKALVLCAVRSDGAALQYAHHDLRRDLQVVRAAAAQNALALEWVTEELRAQPDLSAILQRAIETHGRMLR